MRMRKKKNLEPRLAQCADYLLPEQDCWSTLALLMAGRPLYLEIGCGKGRFVTTLAAAHPECFYLAVEREKNVLLLAMERARAAGLSNLRFLSCDAARLVDLLPQSSVSRIYLNFSDPWPPKRQAKRRLTHRNFLAIYEQLLPVGGEVHFKTDNRGLFEFSLGEISATRDFLLKNITLDLHASGLDNVMTEYEERFSSQGLPIYRLEAEKLAVSGTPTTEFTNPSL